MLYCTHCISTESLGYWRLNTYTVVIYREEYMGIIITRSHEQLRGCCARGHLTGSKLKLCTICLLEPSCPSFLHFVHLCVYLFWVILCAWTRWILKSAVPLRADPDDDIVEPATCCFVTFCLPHLWSFWCAMAFRGCSL